MTSGHGDVIVASQGGVMVTRLPILGSVAIGVHDNDQKIHVSPTVRALLQTTFFLGTMINQRYKSNRQRRN
jgi:hypothetical protein